MFMVKALKNGFYRNVYRYKGDKFRVDEEGQFSKFWMEKLSKGEVDQQKAKEKAEAKKRDDEVAKRNADRKAQSDERKKERELSKERSAEIAKKKAEDKANKELAKV